MQVARFCRWYPGLYLNPLWPTRDHIIPHRLFDRLTEAMPPVLALDRLNLVEGMLGAMSALFASKNETRKMLDEMMDAAFPEAS